MVNEIISRDGVLSESEIRSFVRDACDGMDVDGKRVLFVIPDYTRSMPMPLMFEALYDALHERVAKMDYIIALGTHPPMRLDSILEMLNISEAEAGGKYRDIGIFNHEWQNPDMLKTVGVLGEDEVGEISRGLLREEVKVEINKRVFDYDLVCIVGPVFPHEVVGFSGGNKYFYPGIAGSEILNFFHWLGALITNYEINGTKDTPVRRVVDRAANLIDIEKRCFALNVVQKDTKGIFFGTPEEAWSKAADLSAHTHIVYKDKPFKQVLALAPPMYDEIWTAGKCMYKLEPVVADGGELIIYGKHVDRFSVTHGEYIRKAGYHVRDYFAKRMEDYQDIPRGILAHSTHVRGMGTWEEGIERPRVQVTLATAIPEADCHAVNLGYRDPDSINIDAFRGREDEGILVVDNAGEILYHLADRKPDA
jgi:lactate racemase